MLLTSRLCPSMLVDPPCCCRCQCAHRCCWPTGRASAPAPCVPLVPLAQRTAGYRACCRSTLSRPIKQPSTRGRTLSSVTVRAADGRGGGLSLSLLTKCRGPSADCSAASFPTAVVTTKDCQLICRHDTDLGGDTDANEKFPELVQNGTIDGYDFTGVPAYALTLEQVKSLKANQAVDIRCVRVGRDGGEGRRAWRRPSATTERSLLPGNCPQHAWLANRHSLVAATTGTTGAGACPRSRSTWSWPAMPAVWSACILVCGGGREGPDSAACGAATAAPPVHTARPEPTRNVPPTFTPPPTHRDQARRLHRLAGPGLLGRADHHGRSA